MDNPGCFFSLQENIPNKSKAKLRMLPNIYDNLKPSSCVQRYNYQAGHRRRKGKPDFLYVRTYPELEATEKPVVYTWDIKHSVNSSKAQCDYLRFILSLSPIISLVDLAPMNETRWWSPELCAWWGWGWNSSVFWSGLAGDRPAFPC